MDIARFFYENYASKIAKNRINNGFFLKSMHNLSLYSRGKKLRRIRVRDNSGKLRTYIEKNFSEIEPIEDGEGNEISIEETFSYENSFLSLPTEGKGGDLSLYEGLTGKEAIITFCIARGESQEAIADYFGLSQSTINRIWQRAKKKLEGYLKYLVNSGWDGPRGQR